MSMNMQRDWPSTAGAGPPDDLLKDRIRGEFVEMPGLCLTLGQACRLWQIATPRCQSILDALIAEGFLSQTSNGSYIAQPASTRAATRARRPRR